MYETQFGLNKRPFRALATGSDVFVGPHMAAAMAGLKKALASSDAIVAVGGPVGVGKTTVVRRALDAIGENPVIIWVGRMHLDTDEVLELLLEEIGIDIPAGTVQRFTRFRRQLKQYADDGSRVFIVVEDAARVGPEALSELEALTATDAGVSEGAGIVLMGDEGLDASLKPPQLARLRQRLRLRQNIAPLSGPELLGYLKHCFRLAGNEFDQVFENGSADVLHRLSEGIPRVANNLVESSLISAAENKLDRVNVAQIKLVASEEYGLSVAGLSELAQPPTTEPRAAAPSPQPVAETVAPDAPAPAQAPSAPAQVTPDPIPTPAPVSEPAPSVAATPLPAAPAEDEIPDLIQDTLPDLEVLAPDLARQAEQQAVQRTIEPQVQPQPKKPGPPQVKPQQAEPQQPKSQPPRPQPRQVEPPQAKLQPQPPQAPQVSQEPEPVLTPAEAADEVPEWERDPTLAQLRPDLDALEQALAVAEGKAPDPEADEAESGTTENEPPELVPEITLDRRIQAKVDEAADRRREEEERRAKAEAEKEKESAADNRTTSEILADARARSGDDEPSPKNSVKARFDALLPTLEVPAESGDLHATSDTIHELPVLRDATEPAFEPARHRRPEPRPAPQAKPEPPAERKPEPSPELPAAEPFSLELELDPEPADEPEVAIQPAPESQPPPAPEPSPEELEQARKADAELEQIASNLARAKTIDDCDDKMAETLFGEEFSMMAAQVAANAPAELLGDDEPEEPEVTEQAEAIEESQQPEEPANDEVADPEFAAMQNLEGAAAISVELEADSIRTGPMDTSASQRLQTVRSLSTGAPDAPAASSQVTEPPAPTPPVDQPQSIEDQINTSMTQTLKTLSVPPVVVDDEDDKKSKGGFFSRFRR